MMNFEEQVEGSVGMQEPLATTSPLDVAGVDLSTSTDEIVQIVAERRRSRLPMIEKAATGWPIAALSADELAAMAVDEDLKIYEHSHDQLALATGTTQLVTNYTNLNE